jgi:hypothetical protein
MSTAEAGEAPVEKLAKVIKAQDPEAAFATLTQLAAMVPTGQCSDEDYNRIADEGGFTDVKSEVLEEQRDKFQRRSIEEREKLPSLIGIAVEKPIRAPERFALKPIPQFETKQSRRKASDNRLPRCRQECGWNCRSAGAPRI